MSIDNIVISQKIIDWKGFCIEKPTETTNN